MTEYASLEAIVARAEELYHDVGLEAVKAWKQTHDGAGAIGHLPVWAPRELVHAAGMLPVGLQGGGDDVEIIKGDAYFQSYICHLPRSIVEMALDGSFDVLDGVMFPSTCDVIRNLSGMWRILFEDRPAWYLDLPQSRDDIGIDFFREELSAVRDDFAKMVGLAITDEALAASIALYDENRRLVEVMYEGRRRTPWLFPTSEVYVVMRAGNLIPVDEHNGMIEAYVAAATGSARRPLDNARVVVAGAFCEQPPLNLIRAIEQAGCYVVDDDLTLSTRLINGAIGGEGDPLRNIAAAVVDKARECAFLFCEGRKGDALVDAVKKSDAEGVLFCAASFCDPALLDQPMLVSAVEKAGIPHTSFKYAENTGQYQVIREQAGTFADSIKLWSVA